MGVFYLKYRDTRPILEVALLNPDGSAHDLTEATAYRLHIRRLSVGSIITRDMIPHGALTTGVLRYTWAATDWTGTPALTMGMHAMEYEVIGGTSRLSFPNDGYDVLQVTADLAQGVG